MAKDENKNVEDNEPKKRARIRGDPYVEISDE